MELNVVKLASEAPNENPVLHQGARWICDEPTGHPRAERSSVRRPVELLDEANADAAALDVGEDAPILIEELEPIEARLEGAAPDLAVEASSGSPLAFAPDLAVEASSGSPLASAPDLAVEASSSFPPPSSDPFTRFVYTLADVAIGAGAPHVASILPGLLFDERLPAGLGPELEAALRRAGVCDEDGVTPAFARATSAWRAILRGTSDDFDACGAAMLDEWASELLSRLLVEPTRAHGLRQELRSRGVAAFGIAS